jgi:hypothetical protein
MIGILHSWCSYDKLKRDVEVTMEIIIIGALVGAAYPVYRIIRFNQANKQAKIDLQNKEILETVSFSFKTAIFNSIMAGLSFSLVLASLEEPLTVALYLVIGGLFVANVFDAYNYKRVFLTSNSFYIMNQSVRYQAIESIRPRKHSKKFVITTNQKQTFVVPKLVIERMEVHQKKKVK